MRFAESFQELQPLCDLCRAGRLYDAEKWILAGNPIQMRHDDKNRRHMPLTIALDRGFHSLVELLLRHGADPTANGNALHRAVQRADFDMTELLFRFGADPDTVGFRIAAYTYDRRIMRLFVEAGVDPCEDEDLAHALADGVRTAIGFYKEFQDRIPGLPRQLALALRHYCIKGDVKWIKLLLWAGADPYTPVPDLDKQSDADESPLHEAISFGHIDPIRKLPLDPKKVDLDELLHVACWAFDIDYIRHLLDLGANPNAQNAERNLPLKNLFTSLKWCLTCDSTFHPCYQKDSIVIDMMHLLMERGAKWQPLSRSYILDIRKTIKLLSASQARDLMTALKQHDVMSEEDFRAILVPAVYFTPKLQPAHLEELLDP